MCGHQLSSSLQSCVELPAVVASDYSKGLGFKHVLFQLFNTFMSVIEAEANGA